MVHFNMDRGFISDARVKGHTWDVTEACNYLDASRINGRFDSDGYYRKMAAFPSPVRTEVGWFIHGTPEEILSTVDVLKVLEP